MYMYIYMYIYIYEYRERKKESEKESERASERASERERERKPKEREKKVKRRGCCLGRDRPNRSHLRKCFCEVSTKQWRESKWILRVCYVFVCLCV